MLITVSAMLAAAAVTVIWQLHRFACCYWLTQGALAVRCDRDSCPAHHQARIQLDRHDRQAAHHLAAAAAAAAAVISTALSLAILTVGT